MKKAKTVVRSGTAMPPARCQNSRRAASPSGCSGGPPARSSAEAGSRVLAHAAASPARPPVIAMPSVSSLTVGGNSPTISPS